MQKQISGLQRLSYCCVALETAEQLSTFTASVEVAFFSTGQRGRLPRANYLSEAAVGVFIGWAAVRAIAAAGLLLLI